MRELFCDNKCNIKLDFVYIDGYNFGDKLLEGVLFKVKITNNQPECFGVHSDSESYMEQFNWSYWKKRCEDYCDDIDIAECPWCHQDILVEDI